jgi:hypothetical protein
MGRAGKVAIRVKCPFAARGKLTLRGARASKRFSVRAGKAKTVKIKLSGKARRAARSKKGLRVQAIATIRPKDRTIRSSRQVKRKLTIKSAKRKKR